MKYFSKRDLLWIVPASMGLGAILALLQPGNWFPGWLGFSLLFFLSISLLTISTKWADGGRTLAWMVAVAILLRFAGGVAAYLALPINGFDDEDDRAGFVYTDAHRRDDQAWELATSEQSILVAFNREYASDQYGGLLAFSSFVYRYFSPDAHRPLILVLLAAFAGTLTIPFLWKTAVEQWEAKVAAAAGWVFALYPEAILLGGSSMREPYLMLFGGFALWGFVDWQATRNKRPLIWLGLGVFGMLLVSPVVALVTLTLFAGWVYFTNEQSRLTWTGVMGAGIIFIVGLFLLASALDRDGNLGGNTPFAVINNFFREVVKLNLHQVEGNSGWVQKLFDEMPRGLRLPFVLIYGLFQPVLPAALVEPTTLTWRVIAILRAFGWYMLLPGLVLSFWAAAGARSNRDRKLLTWISLVVWGWILLTSLRGGADQWDNPRYRTILFIWQAVLAGYVWVWWRQTQTSWVVRVISMELVFLLVFGQWYANRYYHFGVQLQFGHMVLVILILWVLILARGLWRDQKPRQTTGV
jgi:hypothetical protein